MENFMVVPVGIMLFVVACNRPESAPSAAASAEPTAAVAVAPSAAPAAASAADNAPAATVPVPEDFEVEAKRTVTPDTLDSQLDKLEKTIASAATK